MVCQSILNMPCRHRAHGLVPFPLPRATNQHSVRAQAGINLWRLESNQESCVNLILENILVHCYGKKRCRAGDRIISVQEFAVSRW
jgi:hypothetical protein